MVSCKQWDGKKRLLWLGVLQQLEEGVLLKGTGIHPLLDSRQNLRA